MVGRTILHIACQAGKLPLVKHLAVNYPSLLGRRDYVGMTTLHNAALSDSVELVDYLISQQCNVFDKCFSGKTVLHIAFEEGKLMIVKHLVENYTDLLKMRDTAGQTPLLISGCSASVELVDYLISMKCDVFDKDNSGRTILHSACYSGNLILVKHLVDNYSALLTIKDERGITPLHAAAMSDSVDLVDYLISRQCDVLGRDKSGRTILHIACTWGKLTLTKHLAKNYPSLLTMSDNAGQTPVNTARSSGSVNLLDYLISQYIELD